MTLSTPGARGAPFDDIIARGWERIAPELPAVGIHPDYPTAQL